MPNKYPMSLALALIQFAVPPRLTANHLCLMWSSKTLSIPTHNFLNAVKPECLFLTTPQKILQVQIICGTQHAKTVNFKPLLGSLNPAKNFWAGSVDVVVSCARVSITTSFEMLLVISYPHPVFCLPTTVGLETMNQAAEKFPKSTDTIVLMRTLEFWSMKVSLLISTRELLGPFT